MNRKQKALITFGVIALMLGPSAASYATETESIVNQTLTTPGISGGSFDGALIPVLGAVKETAIPIDTSRSEPVYIPMSNRELLLEAALTQVGILQDCTDLIQNSLAIIGLETRRDEGGFDYGVRSADRVGYEIDPSEALPGDIAFTGAMDGGHVWVVLDPATSTGVHGGYEKHIVGGEGRTVIAVDPLPLSAHTVYRLY